MLVDWVKETAELCKPDKIYWCDGSEEEYNKLCQDLVDAGYLKIKSCEKAKFLYCLFRSIWRSMRWKTELIFALEEKKMQVLQTIGSPLMKLKRQWPNSMMVAWKEEPCMDSIQHGSLRIRHCAYRCRIIRFCLCSSKHENHDSVWEKKF